LDKNKVIEIKRRGRREINARGNTK